MTDASNEARDQVEIREMELDDLPAVFALGERLFTAELSPALYRTWDEYELLECFASDRETCLVAIRDEAVVGFALGVLIEKRSGAWTYGWLAWMGIEPALGRSGIGHRLVRRLRQVFIEFGARMMFVDTDADNEPAVRFFRGEGFGNEQQHLYLFLNLTQQADYKRRRARSRRRAAAPRPGGGLGNDR